MADLAGIALSGLRASQTSLSTVSHNIVNVDTAGYSRQRTELATRIPLQYGSGFIGQGVDVDGITRISNQFVTDQLRRDTQNFNSYNSYYEYAVRMDSLLGDESTAITPTLQSFFDGLEELANDPSSIAARQVLLSEGQALVNRFNTVYDQVYQQNETLNTEMATIASQVTQLAKSIANLNDSIRTVASNNVGQLPNDLLDQRDEAIRQLSELVGVQVVQDGNLTVNVFIGSGQPLVLGGDSYTLSTDTGNSGISRNNVILTAGNNSQDITAQLSGGRMGGLLQVREELIDPIFNELGRMATVLADTFNDQHQLGMDLNNQIGGLFFGDINSPVAEAQRVSASLDNAGAASLSVTISDVSALTADNYELRFDGANYSLINASSDTTIATFADPGAGGTVVLASEGFTLNFAGGASVAGDSFMITPTRMGAAEISLEIDNVKQVAAAMPVRTQLPQSNTGAGFVENVVVSDTTAADFATPYTLTPPYTVVFTSATTYDVINSTTSAVVVGGVAFTPNQSNGLLQQAGLYPASGYDVVYNGVPALGDQIVMQYNNGGVGDNRNALLLGKLSSTKTIDNGATTYQSAYGQLVSGVGTRTRDAEVGQEASESIMRQSEAQRESISGVNLDEEAADLMRFQQAYQASARVIQVSSELFDSILNSL
ncbi:MAG: flagellar hook-associated protein FlgK [Gammaproteobacteria bacterium]|nr:flagellar hook-associated protein FlgK [Gammaproteobacteria bacterium]